MINMHFLPIKGDKLRGNEYKKYSLYISNYFNFDTSSHMYNTLIKTLTFVTLFLVEEKFNLFFFF